MSWQWLLAVGVAWGCSCLPQRQVCEVYAETPVVFRGTVLRQRDGVYVVQVEERFKGVGAGDAEVIVDPGVMGPFKTSHAVGGEYLFLASGRMPKLVTGMSSGTLAVSEAAADLAWLRGEKKTRVYGRVVQTEPSYRLRDDALGLAGARVTLRDGGRTRVVESGADGVFSFDGVEPGDYGLTAVRYGWRAAGAERVGVAAGGCAYRKLFAGTSGEMSGVVLRHDGVPARGVLVELVPVGAKASVVSVRTDESGRFGLAGVPVGEFYLGVNLRRAMRAEAPWAPRYFPGADTEMGARVFRTRPNEGAHGLQLMLPPPMPVRTVRVRVLWADGKAADRVYVEAVPVGVESEYAEGAWVERGAWWRCG